jgi:hypothetical protein
MDGKKSCMYIQANFYRSFVAGCLASGVLLGIKLAVAEGFCTKKKADDNVEQPFSNLQHLTYLPGRRPGADFAFDKCPKVQWPPASTIQEGGSQRFGQRLA